MTKSPLLLLLFVFLFGTQARAELKLASIFGSNMVLQQNEENAIWGWADPEEKISIAASWLDAPVTATANQEGYWKATLRVPKADLQPHKLTVTADTEVTLENLLFGEVWICSGQSNMAFSVRGSQGQPVLGSNEAIADGNQPYIRHFLLKKNFSTKPEVDCNGTWQEATPQTVPKFTAVGYFFAKTVQNTLKVPVGIINTTWGGTPVEAWMAGPLLKEQFPDVAIPVTDSESGPKKPTTLFNAMIHPLVGLKIQGVLWYQGESNVRRQPEAYSQLFPAMIQDWRERWGQGDFAFHYVQICPFEYGKDLQSQLLREAQLKTLDLVPNVGMAATSDLGDQWCIHPQRKRAVGERLAYGALNQQYGLKHLQYGGPLYKSMKVKEGTAIVEFKNAPMGLSPRDEPLNDFWIAGEDKVFYKASARVMNGREATENGWRALVAVSNENVPQPVAVRYGWSNWFMGTLFDTAGNAASSFRTDDWEGFQKASGN